MATGNIRIGRKRCPSCNAMVKAERNGMVWGCGDLILMLCTLGLWAIIRIILNAISNPWRCSQCGRRL